jgi:hypothetical protein
VPHVLFVVQEEKPNRFRHAGSGTYLQVMPALTRLGEVRHRTADSTHTRAGGCIV